MGDFPAKCISRSGRVQAKWCLAPWDRISGRWRQPPEPCDDRHLASILGLIFETLNTLISGHPAFVPKLTLWNATDYFAAHNQRRR